jgi:transcriptional regulator with XRE-family HTH domain
LQNPFILLKMGKTINGAMEARPEPTGQVYIDRNIRYLRRRHGWSQEELGTRIGLNRGNIASYENGTAEPKICNLLKLAQLFGVSILDITHRDLSQDVQPEEALSGEMPCIEQSLPRYVHQAQELQAVMKGLHTCCHFKVKNAEEASPRDLHVVAMHFEELFHTAQTLLEGHLQLLEQLGAPCLNKAPDKEV